MEETVKAGRAALIALATPGMVISQEEYNSIPPAEKYNWTDSPSLQVAMGEYEKRYTPMVKGDKIKLTPEQYVSLPADKKSLFTWKETRSQMSMDPTDIMIEWVGTRN